MKISFCLITRNEEANLPRCLGSAEGLADEIVVLDSGSTDGTEAVARRFGARWHRRDWTGYVDQKNHLLSLAQHEWVFSLDADEALSEPLRAEVRRLKETGAPAALSGYDMPRCVFYEGRWIRHGDWYPDRLVRLFRRSRARFAGGRVHERLEIQGPIASFHSDLYHYSFKDANDHRARGELYAQLWAETQFEQGRRAGPLDPWLHAGFRWVRGYLIRRGFLDGPPGWRIARLCAREVFRKYRLLLEMEQRRLAERSAPP